MSDTIRDVVLRLSIQQKDSTIQVPDVSPIVEGQEGLKNALTEATAAMGQQAGIAEQMTEAHHHAERSMISAARPLGTLIGGTRHLIHATIELTAANEKDAEAMVRRAMQYDAYFNLLTGGVHVVHGLAHATEILRDASLAAAVAEAAALAPWVAGIALLSVVGIGLYDIAQRFDLFGSKAKAAAAAQKEYNEAIKEYNRSLDEANKQNRLGKLDIGFKDIDRFSQIEELTGQIGPQEKLQTIAEERAELEKRINDMDRFGLGTDEERKKILEREDELETRKLEILRDISREKQVELEKAEAARMEAEKALVAEQDRNQAAAARIGMLNEAEKIELKMLSEKVKAGTASDADYKRLQQLGGGMFDEAAREHFAGKGGNLADETFENVYGHKRRQGEEEAENQAGNAHDQAIRAKREADEANLPKKIEEAGKRAHETAGRLFEAMENVLNDIRILAEQKAEAMRANRKVGHGD